MIIDENQLSSTHNFSNRTKFETTNKYSPTAIDQKLLLIKASSYLSIEPQYKNANSSNSQTLNYV